MQSPARSHFSRMFPRLAVLALLFLLGLTGCNQAAALAPAFPTPMPDAQATTSPPDPNSIFLSCQVTPDVASAGMVMLYNADKAPVLSESWSGNEGIYFLAYKADSNAEFFRVAVFPGIIVHDNYYYISTADATCQ